MNFRRPTILFIALIFCLIAGQPERSQAAPIKAALAQQEPQAPPGDKVLLDNTDTAAVEALLASGAARLVDYGTFSLWSLPPAGPNAMRMYSAYDPLDDNIYLRGGVIDPARAAEEAPAMALQAAPVAEREDQSLTVSEPEGLWIVQFIGPVLPEWEQALRDAGLQTAAYIPNFAYVVWGSQPAQAVETAAAATQAVQWHGPYDPAYRLAPELQELSGSDPVDVTVQVFNAALLESRLAEITTRAVQVYQGPVSFLNTTIVRIQVAANAMAEIAAMPEVLNVEPYHPPEMLDEIQGQTMAGNFSSYGGALGAARPGYLQWLEQKGFPKEPEAYPIVEVVDDGLDTGFADSILHPDFYFLGQRSNPSRVIEIHNCTNRPGGNSVAGHGSLNAGILAGYNDRTGNPYEDILGFQRGLGISPFGRISATRIFDDFGVFKIDPYRCAGGFTYVVEQAYADGARISSNSWGKETREEYDQDAAFYDALTRDASPETGDQSMLHIFAAGNSGVTLGRVSIGTPGTAKNVLTVGASENARDHKISDRCLISNSDSADDVADFSSTGPTAGGRAKPDILAPGTHVQGPASQDPAFNGSQVCGSMDGYYYPSGQSLYTWSSGTSHATPAVSGAAQLLYNFYGRVLRPGQEPSAAMLKALILNTPRYMIGEKANDTLPSPYQGWGSVDMGKIFDGTPRTLVDQEVVFDRTGQTYEAELRRTYSSRPIRISLVWTDVPANPAAARALVNDLDLEVTYQGQVYKGNVFEGAFSSPGGEADRLNNVENVFLPAGTNGSFEIRVISRNLAGDGIPSRPGSTDQDFALVVYNGWDEALFTHSLSFPMVSASPFFTLETPDSDPAGVARYPTGN